MLPWSFSEEGAAEKYMPRVQHNMWVINAKEAALSMITDGGKRVEITIAANSLYQHLLLTAEKKFWRCVESGNPLACSLPKPAPVRFCAARLEDGYEVEAVRQRIARRGGTAERGRGAGGGGQSARIAPLSARPPQPS